jgi:hypothetical protein
LFSKLLYPYHPLHGTDIEVLGGAGGQRDLIYVRLPDKSTKGVPAWMFDPGVCAGVRMEEKPVIDCRALVALSQLLDRRGTVDRSVPHDQTTNSDSKETPSAKP